MIFAAAGCAPDSAAPKPTPIPTAPPLIEESDDQGPVPFPELPSGAGPIDEDATQEFTTTKSGLKYRILRTGNGKKPTLSSRLDAHYRGWLKNGNEFDSSYKKGKPMSFSLGGVVDGWKEGIPYCDEGGMIELVVPPKLGYGPSGMGPIPPNATLNFLVEVKSVK